MRLIWTIGVLALTMTGCVSASTSEENTQSEDAQAKAAEEAVGGPIELAVGDSVRASESLRVAFAEVDGDSRCPVDVHCMTAGQANVVLHFQRGDEAAVEQRIAVPPGGEVRVEFEGSAWNLSLAPEARSDEPAEERAYRVKLLPDLSE